MRRGTAIGHSTSPPGRNIGNGHRLLAKDSCLSPCKSMTTASTKSASPCKEITTVSTVEYGKSSADNYSQHLKPVDSLDPLTPLQMECMTLIHYKQYKSSETVARFELSNLMVDFQKVYNSSSGDSMDKRRSMSIATKANTLATTLEIIADCSFFTDQTRRALHYYRQAINYRRIASTHGCAHGALVQGKFRNDRAVLSTAEATLRLKESDCLSSMGELSEAIFSLENAFRLHSTYRTLAVCMTLGNLYLATSKKADAIRSFTDALRLNPYAMEAIANLAIVGANKEDVLRAVSEGMQMKLTPCTTIKKQNRIQNKENRDCDPLNRSITSHGQSITERSQVQLVLDKNATTSLSSTLPQLPVSQLVSAHFDSFSNNTKAALHAFQKLDKMYPNNIYILQSMAKLQLKNCENIAAKETYEKIRTLDEFSLEGMDRYVALIASTSRTMKNKVHSDIDDHTLTTLYRISSTMLDANKSRFEPWLALAIYHRMKHDILNALTFCDKAISCCPSYAFSHQLRGTILLSDRKPEQAIASFQRANELSGDMDSYEGLVEGYLAAEKFREALFAAKEAMNLSPKDPRALSLVGLTLAYSCADSRVSGNNGSEEKAKAALKKALEIDPSAPRPLFKLVELYLKSKEYKGCVEILTNAIDSEKDGTGRTATTTWSTLNVCHLQPLSYYAGGAAARECKDILYTKLGIIHTLLKNYIEACKALHIALSLNPSNKEARRACNHLEKVMTGVEPGMNDSDDDGNRSWDQRDDDSDEHEY